MLALAVLIFALFVYRREVGGALLTTRLLLSSFWDRSFAYEKYISLTIENERLKRELAKLNQKTSKEESFIEAEVYSRYPFNDAGFMVIGAGLRNGASSSLPVLVSKGTLLGKIVAVKRTQSEVETIVNPAWRSAVLIGEGGVRAVLRGGSPPQLEFVPSESSIKSGDEILNAAPDFPLGLFIGTVEDVAALPQTPWISASVKLPYDPGNLRKVLIFSDFP